ncbi:hypothetical protein A9313_22160 [Yersinia pestis]|nr:hypothetical protein A9313_22160 [Yersinia pestis]
MRLKSSIAITGRGEFKRTSGSFDRFSGRTIFAVGFDVQSQMSLTMPPSKNWLILRCHLDHRPSA